MKYKSFIFEKYDFNKDSGLAEFHYSFDHERYFCERVTFTCNDSYNEEMLERTLWMAFLIAGTSYYKTFPTTEVDFPSYGLTPLDVELLTAVYHDGLSQFVFENNLTPDILPTFIATVSEHLPLAYAGQGVLVLQSGGKDSLLLGELLNKKQLTYNTIYMTSGDTYPGILDDVSRYAPRLIRRKIDREALHQASQEGGINGHIPITHLTFAYALIDAVLHGENTVLAAIGQEGAEPHEFIGDFAINHQWSKTWMAEELLSRYVRDAISSGLKVGSPLRALTELRIAELFVEYAWDKFGHRFSSCNLANYKQSAKNDQLSWCGECPKCANSFLLFAPFVEPSDLMTLFDGQNLFMKASLTEIFKGLLGVEGVMKPFECVGGTGELRQAFHMAQDRYGAETYSLPFAVPFSDFDYHNYGPAQSWASDLLIPI